MRRKQLFTNDTTDNFIERRRSERMVIIVPVEMVMVTSTDESMCKKGDVITGHTINISSGGLLTKTGDSEQGTGGLLTEVSRQIPLGSVVKIMMNIPLPGYTSTFVLEGTVLRNGVSYEDPDKFETAIQFLCITRHQFNNAKLDFVRRMLGL